MRRSNLFSITWSSRPKQETCRQLVSGLVLTLLLLVLPAAAQTPTPQLSADLSHSPGWVVIPVDEYQNLRARAFPAEREPDPPPVDATLTRVDYDLRISGELATGRASLTVDVLKDGWVRVPIPTGLLVREARLDGKLVSLVSGGPGKSSSQLSAVLAHAGRAVLLLDIALPVNASAGEERISLPSTSSGVTRASVQLPRQGVDVKLTGGLLAEKTETAVESKWLAYARGNEPLTFIWHRKMEDHHVTLPLRQRGSLTPRSILRWFRARPKKQRYSFRQTSPSIRFPAARWPTGRSRPENSRSPSLNRWSVRPAL
jgi:hypothetical protein